MYGTYQAINKIRKVIIFVAVGYCIYLAFAATHPLQYVGSTGELEVANDLLNDTSLTGKRKLFWLVFLGRGMFSLPLLAVALVGDILKIFVHPPKGKIQVIIIATIFYLLALWLIQPVLPVGLHLLSLYL